MSWHRLPLGQNDLSAVQAYHLLAIALYPTSLRGRRSRSGFFGTHIQGTKVSILLNGHGSSDRIRLRIEAQVAVPQKCRLLWGLQIDGERSRECKVHELSFLDAELLYLETEIVFDRPPMQFSCKGKGNLFGTIRQDGRIQPTTPDGSCECIFFSFVFEINRLHIFGISDFTDYWRSIYVLELTQSWEALSEISGVVEKLKKSGWMELLFEVRKRVFLFGRSTESSIGLQSNQYSGGIIDEP